MFSLLKILSEIADERQKVYMENGLDDYMFKASDDVIIDATLMGNIARLRIIHNINVFPKFFLKDGVRFYTGSAQKVPIFVHAVFNHIKLTKIHFFAIFLAKKWSIF